MENPCDSSASEIQKSFLYNIVEDEFTKYYEILELAHNPPDPLRVSHLCRICGSKYATFEDLTCHSLHHFIENKYHCRKCLTFCRSIEVLRDHAENIHLEDPTIKCPYCAIEYSNHAQFETHIKFHRHYRDQVALMGATKLRIRMFYICMTCGKVCWHKSELIEHRAANGRLRKPGEPLACSQVAFKNQLRQRRTAPPLAFNCTICKRTFTEKSHLMVHLVGCRKTLIQKNTKRRKLSQRELFHLDHLDENEKISERFAGIKVVCAICNATCSLKRQLRSHIRMGHGDFIYICETCGYEAKDEFTVMNHKCMESVIESLNVRIDFPLDSSSHQIPVDPLELPELPKIKIEIKTETEDVPKLESFMEISDTLIKKEENPCDGLPSNISIKEEPDD